MDAATALPPGPTGPPIEHLLRFIDDPHGFLESCERRYGEYFTVRLPGMPPNVVFTDPDAVRDLFTAKADDVRVGEIAGVLAPIMGKRSVMLLDGEDHRRERRRMMPPFRGSSVKRYGPEIQRAARAMTATWRAGRELSALAELHRVTLDIILGITFGTLAAMAQQELRTSLERFLKLGTSPLANAVLWLTPKPKVEPWIYRPVRASRTLARLLPWSSVVDAQDAMDRLIYRTIRARRAAPDPDANDLLSLLLRARDDDGEGMSDVELRDQIVTLLLAGHETTATTLAWTLAHLMASPAIYAKVATTLRARVLAEGPLSIDAIMDDPWLDGCLKESMRLSPVAPTVGRHLGAPTKIGRYDLPAGVNAIACVYLAQRRADHFEKPRAFRPERWFDQRVPPYDFFPFGGGSRRCLGMALAYYEMKIVLAEMLIAVDLESGVPRPLIPVRKGVTFAPIDGLPVRVLRRHQEGSLHGSAQPSLRSNARSS